MKRRELWAHVESERGALAARVLELSPEQWDANSRCRGWRVRDVLGHLVHMAESTTRSMSRDIRSRAGRDRDLGLAAIAKELGEHPVPELCRRLTESAAGRYNHLPGVALTEVITHGDDMLRPLGAAMVVKPEVAVTVLRQLRRVDLLTPRWAFHGRSHRGVRLVASDVGWASGRGPLVEGAALDLVALMTNRPGATDALAGPGVVRLPELRARGSTT